MLSKIKEKHHGEIVEYITRRKGYGVTELARLANVNRRSVYNWFNQRYLKTEIIHRIGVALQHDFHQQFPELFTEYDFAHPAIQNNLTGNENRDSEITDTRLWKDRYISLLENYNQLISQHPKLRELSDEMALQP